MGTKWLGRLWVLGLITGILSGCSSREEKVAYDRLQRKAETLQQLQKLEKVIFRPGTEDETIILIQYLPQKTSTEGEEHFIIAGTPADRITPSTIRGSSLDGRPLRSVRSVAHRALPPRVRQRIPRWFASYDVYYPLITKKKFPLSLTVGGERKILYFYKGPKYLIEKKTFFK